MKLKSKLSIVLVSIAIIPVLLLSIIEYEAQKNTIISNALQHLDTVATLHKARLEGITKQNTEKFGLISSKLGMKTLFNEYLNTRNKNYLDQLNANILEAKTGANTFNDIRLLDLNGIVIASTTPDETGQNESGEDFFIKGIAKVDVSSFFVGEDKSLHIYLAGPLVYENKRIGVVVIDSTADNIVSMIRQDSGIGQTGEALLAAKDSNGNAVLLTPTRLDPEAALRIVSKTKNNTAIVLAVEGIEETSADLIDYDGNHIFAVTKYINEEGWGLVVKMNADEATLPLNSLKSVLLFIITTIVLFVGGVTFYFGKIFTQPLIDLKDKFEEISTGKLDVEIEPKLKNSKDEISDLANALDRVIISLKIATKKVGLTREELKLGTLVEEKHQIEGKLRESKDLIDEILEHAGLPVIAFAKDGSLLIANKPFLKMSGYDKDELSTRDDFLKEAFPSKLAREKIDKVIEDVYSGKEISDFVIPLLCKNSSTRIMVSNIGRIIDSKGGTKGEIYFMRDVSEVFNLEKQLRYWAANGFTQTDKKGRERIKSQIEISGKSGKSKSKNK